MTTLLALSLYLQYDSGVSGNNSMLLMILVALVAAALLVQAGVMIGMAVGAAKAQKKIFAIVEDLERAIKPMLASSQQLISSSQELLDDVQPKVKVISSNLVETSNIVRERAASVGQAVNEITERSLEQIVRVDGMVTGSLDSVQRVATSLERGIMVSVKQIQGVLNGLRVGFDVLIGKGRSAHSAADSRHEDMFI
ncbi:MAG: hypothetical protein ACYCSN_06195 [Acidobacteriaceae bacterium]